MTLVLRPPAGGDTARLNPSAWPALSRQADGESGLAAPRETVSDWTLLFRAGVRPHIINEIMAIAERWNVAPTEIALALGLVDADALLRVIAAAAGVRYANAGIRLRRLTPEPEPHRLLKSWQPLPLDGTSSFAINARAFTPKAIIELAGELGADARRLVLADRPALSRAVVETYGDALAAGASGDLLWRHPRFSAASGPRRWQLAFLGAATGLFLGAFVFMPRETVALYSALLSLMFLLAIALRATAAGHALYRGLKGKRTLIPKLAEADLPHYTVMVAMYHEAAVLPGLVDSLMRLDYPAAKLDIKLVLEAVDGETIAAANALALPPYFEVVIVPDGWPRTKPRALNYALQFARGDYLVIYDAEDRPEPNQLRKAAGHFHDAAPEVACLQARLIFDNYAENWLSRQCTIEYASLFGGILPMLDAAQLPLPLGGTSNHFRIKALRGVGGWDAHNVTEDADLGMRLYRAGLRAEVLESTTYEEAACQPGNWLRQRTRWLKGWLQTYMVHMRQPVRLLRDLGLRGFLVFQGHFAGTLIAALMHPVSYVLVIHDLAAGIIFDPHETVIGHDLWLLAVFNMAAGYAASLTLGYFVLRGRRIRRLIPYLAYIPIYWLFISVAAYRAVYHFVTAPQHWEKTEHGLSRQRQRRHPGKGKQCQTR